MVPRIWPIAESMQSTMTANTLQLSLAICEYFSTYSGGACKGVCGALNAT